MKIKLYQDYKDTEIEWLPEIPKHWEVHRAKSMFNKMSRPIALEDGIITVFRDGQVTLRENRRITGFTNAIEEYGYQGLRKGDLVFHAMDAFAGAVGVSDSDGKATAEYLVYTPINKHETHVPFYGLLLRQMALSGFVLALGKSVRERSPRFKHTKFVSLELPVPPLFEQKTIAHYLDTKTAQIDRKIDLLTQKATLYSNLKQSLINETVTRGLDKTAPMKDSGIEWIGEVPKHWKIKRVKELFEISRGRVIALTELVEDGHYPVYSSQTKDNGCLGYINTFDYEGEYVTWTTDGVNAGTVFMRRGQFNCTNICGTLKLKSKKQSITYFSYSLQVSTRHNKRIDTNGAKIMSNEMAFIQIVAASLSEQEAIADYLDTKTAQIDQIIQTINTQIEKLKELRKTLINDVVTGKIKIVDN